jgi:hypothetical protein
MTPPDGKVMRIVAAALLDEHKPHGAFIASESAALVIYTGEPDEIRSIDVINKPSG